MHLTVYRQKHILVHVLYEYFIGQVLERLITQNPMGFENSNVPTYTFWILDS